jgi:hypothetical protein
MNPTVAAAQIQKHIKPPKFVSCRPRLSGMKETWRLLRQTLE